MYGIGLRVWELNLFCPVLLAWLYVAWQYPLLQLYITLGGKNMGKNNDCLTKTATKLSFHVTIFVSCDPVCMLSLL